MGIRLSVLFIGVEIMLEEVCSFMRIFFCLYRLVKMSLNFVFRLGKSCRFIIPNIILFIHFVFIITTIFFIYLIIIIIFWTDDKENPDNPYNQKDDKTFSKDIKSCRRSKNRT